MRQTYVGYLPTRLGGSHWHARRSLERIVVIGDSYSKSSEGQTWVDCLQRQLRKQSGPSEIHNFAFPGATAEEDLSNQLSRFLTMFSKKDSIDGTLAWDSDGTTYFLFLGINDCGNTECDELESIIETLFDALHDLYVKASARNFVLINVPPIDRSPQAVDFESPGEIEKRVKTWNELLQAQATDFAQTTKEATVLIFSSHQLLTEVLEDPLEYDFSEDDPTTEGGGIWMDDLHLTSEVHGILAEQLLKSLLGTPHACNHTEPT
ncbi:carbohydrate esterase family 16 protein [Auriscalpium vulgare]|uniref:Carbohydrate esterase family 16 protein n=1 Tax=Auriscalpium vulgare TaxID=40419 RepID=A0ACB8SC88_9AGAM|nr:carbohydrate esterase family 16 protein [Auriscalpium vulgare]